MSNDFKLAGMTITGKDYDLNNAFDLYILIKSNQLWEYLICLGYEEKHVLGIFQQVATVWAITKNKYWSDGEYGTISVVIACLLENRDKDDKESKLDKLVLMVVSALFCFDRAVVANSRGRLEVASNWLYSADELFFLSSRTNNITEKDIIGQQARKAAFAKHKETYELKKQAIDYWTKNIDKSLSNEKAADLLIKIVPVSHRKLSEYISEAKKLHSASKV